MTRQPDILFLMPDQLRPDFLGCYGADFIATPNIDGLAAHGVRHDACISPAPICVPARASLLTGLSAIGHGVMDNLHWPRPDRAAMGLRTWPEMLASAGYVTSAVGKMHFYPWDIAEGFSHRIIAEDKRHIHVRDHYDAALRAAGLRKLHGRDQPGYAETKGASISELPDEYQVDRWVAGQAADTIRDLPADRPLAMMVGFPGPHCPYDPPAEALASVDAARLPAPVPATEESRSHRAGFIAAYKRPWADLDYTDLTADQIRAIRHHYAALVQRLDADVGRIVDALRDAGRLDNTIVVFSSDHGDYLGDFGLVGKSFFHEPSVRVPLIVADFRRPPEGRVETAPVALHDLYPSFVQWAGLDVPAHAEGRPLGTPDADRIIVGATTQGFMARSAGWKLVRYRNGAAALYDLAADPDEQTNRIAQASPVLADLDAALTRAILQGLDAAHADKVAIGTDWPPDHDFYRRGWARPYPAQQV